MIGAPEPLPSREALRCRLEGATREELLAFVLDMAEMMGEAERGADVGYRGEEPLGDEQC